MIRNRGNFYSKQNTPAPQAIKGFIVHLSTHSQRRGPSLEMATRHATDITLENCGRVKKRSEGSGMTWRTNHLP